MADAPPARPARPGVTLEVLRTERVTPTFLRIVLGGPGLEAYQHTTCTDRYVKLLLPPPDAGYAEPFDAEEIRATRPEAEWPRLRTYTVRRFDPEAGELWIDLFDHGDVGIAGPWARRAQPGDLLRFFGPGGAYAPDPTAPWHLLVGDEAALPAIASAIEAIPGAARIIGVFEATDRSAADYLAPPAGADVRWLWRGEGTPSLLDAVRELALPEGDGQAFVHGELRQVRAIRRHLLDERAFDPGRLSLSGYWREGKDEEGFQAEKREERPTS